MLKTFALATGNRNEFVQQGSTPENLILGKKDTALLFATWDEANEFRDRKTYPINNFYVENIYPRTLIIGKAVKEVVVTRYGNREYVWIIKGIDGNIYYIVTRSHAIEDSTVKKNGDTFACFTAGLVRQEGNFYRIAYPKTVDNYEQIIKGTIK